MRMEDCNTYFGVMAQVSWTMLFLEMFWPLMPYMGKTNINVQWSFFSGVNNHNKTIVFASAIVSNETEETYV